VAISKTLPSDPPFCCQPPMTEAECRARGERLDAAMQAARDAQPKACPVETCKSTNITPTFLWPGDDDWECHDCLVTWTVSSDWSPSNAED
jgi:hypothetical protein